MSLSFISKSDLVIGVDIGSHAIKVCQLKKSRNGYSIVALGSAILPEGAVDDGTLYEQKIVGESISDLLKKESVQTKQKDCDPCHNYCYSYNIRHNILTHQKVDRISYKGHHIFYVTRKYTNNAESTNVVKI